MSYKLKRQIVDKIHKCKDEKLIKLIAKMLHIKQGVILSNENIKTMHILKQE